MRCGGTCESGPGRGDWLWLSVVGNHLTVAGVAQLLKRTGEVAGVPGLRAHLFRRAWCHYSLAAGVDSLDVQTLAGWTTGAQLARYGAVLRTQRALDAARAHPVAQIVRKGR